MVIFLMFLDFWSFETFKNQENIGKITIYVKSTISSPELSQKGKKKKQLILCKWWFSLCFLDFWSFETFKSQDNTRKITIYVKSIVFFFFSVFGTKFRAGDGRLAGWPGSWPGWLGWQAGWLELAAWWASQPAGHLQPGSFPKRKKKTVGFT